MRALIACEESQAVANAMREVGVEAYSCDILPCTGGHPEYHLQQDILPLLEQEWDMIIAFPPCTYLTVTGNKWFNVEKYGERAVKRLWDRVNAVGFFMAIANAKCDRIAIENPVGIMNTWWRKPDQIFHPYHFGDPFEKRTCLWLKGLPKLQHTNIVEPPPRRIFESGRSMAAWYADQWNLSDEERSIARSKTFPGVARAMAEQWSNL